MNKKIQILDKEAVDRKINRLAWEIYEKNSKENEIVIIGISGRGEILALSCLRQFVTFLQ